MPETAAFRKPFPTRRLYLLAGLSFALLEIFLILFIDKPLALALHTLAETDDRIIAVFRFYTDIGLGKWYEWPSGIAFLLTLPLLRLFRAQEERQNKIKDFSQKIGFFFLATSGAGLLTDLLKPLVGRTRPKLLFQNDLFTFHPFSHGFVWTSFPSGHTTTAFAVAAALSLLFPKGRFFFMLYAVLVGLSRIMVTAHYPSDVMAGALIGLAFTLWIARLFPFAKR